MTTLVRSKLFAGSKNNHLQALIADEHGLSGAKRCGSFSCPSSNAGSRSGSAARLRRTSLSAYSSLQHITDAIQHDTHHDAQDPERSGSGVPLKGAAAWSLHLRSQSRPAQLPSNTATLQQVAGVLAKQPAQNTVLLVDSTSKHLQGIITRKDIARIKQARLAHAPAHIPPQHNGPVVDPVLEAAAGAWWARGEEPAMLWAVAPVVALPYTLATPGAAAALMLGYGVSHLPVVDEEGKALCVLTQASVAAFLLSSEEDKQFSATASNEPHSGGSAGSSNGDGVLGRLMLGAGVRDLDTRFDQLSHLAAAVHHPKLTTSTLPPLPPVRTSTPSRSLNSSSGDLANAPSPPRASASAATKSLSSIDEDQKLKALVIDSAWDVLDGVAGMLAVSAAAAASDPATAAVAAGTVASASGLAKSLINPMRALGRLLNAGQDGRTMARMVSELLKGVSTAGVVTGVPGAVQALVGSDCSICQTLKSVFERVDHDGTVQWAEAGAEAAAGCMDSDACGADGVGESGQGAPSTKAAVIEVLHTVNAGGQVVKGIPTIVRLMAALDPTWVEVLNMMPLLLPLMGPSFDYAALHTHEAQAQWLDFLDNTQLDAQVLGTRVRDALRTPGQVMADAAQQVLAAATPPTSPTPQLVPVRVDRGQRWE